MKTLRLLLAVAVVHAEDGDLVNDRVSRGETVQEFLGKNGYPFEEHVAETTDGYLLTMHRIPRPGAPAVLLQHGILGDSWNFLVNTDDRSIAQNAYRAGYDVWLLNNRGSTYGLQHTTLERRTKQFWNFSFAEMGRLDLPAQIGKVLEVTGQDKVSYLGWSQGACQMLLALQDPEVKGYLERHVNLASMISPVSYLKYSSSTLLNTLTAFHLNDILAAVYPYGLLTHEEDETALNAVVQFLCKITLGLICKLVVTLVAGYSYMDSNWVITNSFTAKFPAGVSAHDLDHWGQLVGQIGGPSGIFKPARFGDFDFKNKAKNIAAYGTETPYDYGPGLANVKVPLALFAASRDDLVEKRDYNLLLDDLAPSNSIVFQEMYQGFSHLTWVAGNKKATDMWLPQWLEQVALASSGHWETNATLF